MSEFTCESCPGSKFANRDSLRCHRRRFHLSDITNKKTRQRNDNEVVCEKIRFASISDFNKWKLKIEKETTSKFSKESRSWRTTDKVQKTKYVCHRSGKIRIKKESERQRALKIKGSCKIGKICPAFIRVEQKECESNVTVFYNGNHSNHENELKFINLSSVERDEIADRLKTGVEFDRILDDIRNSFDDAENNKLTKQHLTTKKDLHNISRDYRIAFKERFSGNEHTSLDKMIEAYNEKFGNETPFKFFKTQGVDGPENISKDDFLLVIMTEAQKKIMRQFGPDGIICVDSTHGTNSYAFTLTTILVVDNYGMALAAGHFISNHENETFLKTFFEIIKTECGVIKAKVFMSDDYPAYINAWDEVMEGRPEKVLLCTWHVDENIRKHLSTIRGGACLKADIYKMIRTVMIQLKIEDFNELLDHAIERLRSDEATQAFGKYFEREYVPRAPMWAFAHRTDVGININMKLEALHRDLKQVYCKGRKIKRLDQTIYLLLKMSRDKIFDRATQLVMCVDTHALKNIRQCHKKAELIQKIDISFIDSNTYSVSSHNDKSYSYTITKARNDCNCNLRCVKCKICVHAFKCSCLDNSIQGHLCKHIHAIAIHSDKTEIIPTVPDVIEPTDIGNEIVVSHNIDQYLEEDFQVSCEFSSQSQLQNISKEAEGNMLLKSAVFGGAARKRTAVTSFSDDVDKLLIFIKQLDPEDPDNIAACKRAKQWMKKVIDEFDCHSAKGKPPPSQFSRTGE